MMFRTYGRKGRGLGRSYSGASSFADGVPDYSSQECPQDVYDFGFTPPQDSAQCPWSDPYSFDSPEEPRELEFLASRKVEDCVGGGALKLKKAKMVGVHSEPFGSSSSRESKEIEVLEISDGDFQKSKKLKKVNFDPFEYNSSEDDVMVLPQSKGRGNRGFEFPKQDNLWKSKKSKHVNSDVYMVNSSQELSDLGIRSSSKSEDKKDCRELERGLEKSKKKDMVENGVLQKKKKKKKEKRLMKSKEPEPSSYVELTTTLMETQEFGEMMEHEDEVNFALDGLRKGQPVKIRRASLLSLLSICGSMQQRTLLRVHGMAKTIIDAVLGLSFDDPPSNLAAAALLYILTSDGQDDHILHSPNCIRFLVKLLKPITSSGTKNKSLPVGSKLIGLCKNAGLLQESAKGTDSSTTAIMVKVREILANCKEIRPNDDSDCRMEDPKLNPKWISLLTMEKACSSGLSMEETSTPFRKSGANFKEKLREFGGLDAVFEVARKCHLIMEEWLEKSPTFAEEAKDISGLESLELLLKCLKIMENVTFLSKDNQCHLLEMRGGIDGQQSTRSFVKLVLSVIKILSGVSLLRSSLSSSGNEKTSGTSNRGSHSGPSKSSNETNELSTDPLLLKMRIDSSESGSFSGTSRISNGGSFISNNDLGTGKRQLLHTNFEIPEDTQDPFAFDEDDFEPSKWDIMYGDVKNTYSQESRATVSGYKDRSYSMVIESQQESNHIEHHHFEETPISSGADEDKSNLLADCLLTAVKVLMNLTNDNPEGCHQIATHGGLEVLVSLIAGHFPSFVSSLPHFDDVADNSLSSKSSPRSNTTLTDQELDFLVSILGLLVNLVEKDGRNRSRLAATSVSVPGREGSDLEQNERDVISLLCSIFLANQGSGEAAGGEEKYFSLEDEESLLQGQKEAEKMIVEAYSALLLAFLSTESKHIRKSIGECLPNCNLKILVPVLERFVEFHMTLNVISAETHGAVLEVIESCRMP